MAEAKSAYVYYGPIAQLRPYDRKWANAFCEAIGRVCAKITHAEPFLSHQHPDPQAKYDKLRYVSVLVAVVMHPLWCGGGEIDIAHKNGIPIVLVVNEKEGVVPSLREHANVCDVILFGTMEQVLVDLEQALQCIPPPIVHQPDNGASLAEANQQTGLSH
jgi:hypothetical protein